VAAIGSDLPPSIALLQLATGYYVACAIHAVAELGIADLLKDGPRSHEGLAAATRTHAPSLRRVLRLLASENVLAEEQDGRFALTPIGDCLRRDAPDSVRDPVLLFGGQMHRDWLDLRYCLETGQPAFRRAGKTNYFSRLMERPGEAEIFDKAMDDLTSDALPAIAASYDFAGCGTIVDVGGGSGLLIEGLLARNPGLRGILYDQAHVVERARARLAGSPVAGRCMVQAGDFFHEVPSGGGAYVLKNTLHDWNDEEALAILKACRRAMPPEARLLVLEGVYPRRIEPTEWGRYAAIIDVNLLVSTSGRQRSVDEFRALFEAAGFALARIVPLPATVAMIEGVPKPA